MEINTGNYYYYYHLSIASYIYNSYIIIVTQNIDRFLLMLLLKKTEYYLGNIRKPNMVVIAVMNPEGHPYVCVQSGYTQKAVVCVCVCVRYIRPFQYKD